MLRRLLLPLILALACTATSAVAAEPPAKEQGLRAKTAAEIGKFVGWCAQNGARSAGEKALDELKALAPGSDGIDERESALTDAEDSAEDTAVAKARKVRGTSVAKAFDGLAKLKHADDDRARFDGYRLDALRWDPSKSRAKKTAAWVKKQEDVGRRARLLARARAAAGAAGTALDTLAVSLAKDAPLLLGSAEHDLVGWLWLPKSWKKGKSYPVLIGVDGAGSNHKGYGAKSASARGSRNAIVLAPVTLSNTNVLAKAKYPHYAQSLLDEWTGKRLEFDGAGVDALLAEIRALFGGEEKVFLTGFSGGGQYTYYKLLTDPEHVAGAVPCCANFAGNGKQGAPKAGDGGGPPVRILTGEQDKHREFTHGDKNSPGIEPQTDHAMKTLTELGYKNVERIMVKAGHSPLHAKVWKFVDEVLGKR